MKPTDLRGILQYVPKFRDRTFVIAVDGAIVLDENFANILLDIAVLRSLNIRVVLVHGASAYIKTLAGEQQLSPSDLEGSGVTDASTLQLAMTASNRLTHEVLEGLNATDLRAASCNAVTAFPMGILRGRDHLYTGRVERVDIAFLQSLLTQGTIPVLPPLGFDGEGNTYRLNSDAVAVAAAQALGAIKLIFITTTDGLSVNGGLVRQMLAAELDQVIEKQPDSLQSLSKAQNAATACRAGIPRVHIINGHVFEGLLAEVFSNEGIGTLIYANEYQQIRKAQKKDVRSILNLIKSSVATDELVRRSRATVERQLEHYYLFEIDNNPVACVALLPFEQEATAELACLYVNPSHENQGIGQKMIHFAEGRAQERGLKKLVALSTQTFAYLQSKAGFREGNLDDLPPQRQQQYRKSRRQSKILVKSL